MILARFGHAGVRAIDAILRRTNHVFNFSADPSCIFRLAVERCPRDITLSDGVHLEKGTLLLGLHFWNEHLAAVVGRPGNLKWGLELARVLHLSLQDLARFIETHPEFDGIPALYGEGGFIQEADVPHVARLAQRIGLDFIAGERPGLDFRRGTFWKNLFSYWMVLTFGRDRPSFSNLQRFEVWISRERLLKRYGTHRNSPPEEPHSAPLGVAPLEIQDGALATTPIPPPPRGN